jgi:hypothetical protein
MSESPIDKRINKLLRRWVGKLDEAQQRSFNRTLDRGGEITEKRFDSSKDKLKTKKMDRVTAKLARQLDAAYAEKANQQSGKPYKLKTSQMVGRGGGGGSINTPDEVSRRGRMSLLRRNN